MTPIRRGQVYFAQFGPVVDVTPGVPSLEIAKHRPVIVLSIDAINRVTDRRPFYVLVMPGTTGASSFRPFPSNVLLRPAESGLRDAGVFLAHQVRSIDSRRLDPQPAGKLSDAALARVEAAVRYCFGLGR